MDAEEIISYVKLNNDSGLTLLGGEPLDQAKSVLKLIQTAHSNNIDVMLYTGYELDELTGVRKQCISLADIAIYGRYKHELRSVNLLWRGSTNQVILINNQKFSDIDLTEKRQLEVHFDETGQLKVVGYPTDELIEFISQRNGELKNMKKVV